MRRPLALALVLSAPALVRAQVPVVEAVVNETFGAAMLHEEGALLAGCSLACAYEWTTAASSSLPAQRGNAYGAAMLEDRSARTAWVEGAAGDGVGERLVLTIQPRVDTGEDGRPVVANGPVSFSAVELVNGYAKDAETWRRNGRVRELLLSLNGRPAARLLLRDSQLPQSAALPPGLEVRPGDRVELEIRAVYPGTRHRDTAITELILGGAH